MTARLVASDASAMKRVTIHPLPTVYTIDWGVARTAIAPMSCHKHILAFQSSPETDSSVNHINYLIEK